MMSHAMVVTCAAIFLLFVLFVWICIAEVIANADKDEQAEAKFKPVAVPKRVRLELSYPSVLRPQTLHMPVKNIFHAQEIVDGLGLKEANLGYRRSEDGTAVVLYTLDDKRVLRRISEVV